LPKFPKGKSHKVAWVTLPGHDKPFLSPDDPTVEMANYVKRVVGYFPKSGEEVILIGHSMGGQVITHVAAEHPSRIDRLIYVAAMLPQDGQSANDIKKDSKFDPAKSTLQLAPYLEMHRDVFASQPEGPLNEKFKLPDATDGTKLKEFNALSRYYILCTKDEVLPSAHQKLMVKAAGIKSDHIEKIDSDHIPQKSKPNELNAALKKFIDAT
jgi:pimeloyl-ACP methyl ester carboxylesterase